MHIPEKLISLVAKFLSSWRAKQTKTKNLLFDCLRFWKELENQPLVVNPEIANKQHYEVSTEFFTLVLGPRLKYSCFVDFKDSAEEAEENSLKIILDLLELRGNEAILDLGCGWGSLSCYILEKFPNVQLTALTNSNSQAKFVEEKLKSMARKATVLKCNFEAFSGGPFDRVVALESLEHLRSWPKALKKISSLLKPNGIFVWHFFCTVSKPYIYEAQGLFNWMARNFFSEGLMPSPLFLFFQNFFSIKELRFFPGTDYGKTADFWIANFKKNRNKILDIMEPKVAFSWLCFFIGVREFFALNNGEQFFITVAKLQKQ